jgi:hypothetical protein
MTKKVTSIIRVNTYDVIVRAVDEGVAYGANRAFKHTETPTIEEIKQAIATAVLNELCEILIFDNEA